jgi:thioredoxin 1
MSNTKNFSELIMGDKLVLVDFYATWCGPCQMMQPILQEVAAKVGGSAKIIKIDVDKNPVAASKFQIRGVPTMILFRRGKPLWRQSGVVSAHQLVQIIEKYEAERV